MQLINHLNWRYATKKFDPNKKLSTTELDHLKEAIRLSPSSYGLQLYKVLIITDPELRARLRPFSYNQSQITDCSHLFVFCHYSPVTRQNVYDAVKSHMVGRSEEDIAARTDFMMERVSGKAALFPEEELFHWCSKQTYIALETLLLACAELKIDACPMEGFNRNQYDDELNLKARGLATSVIATVGFRSDTDAHQHSKKARRPLDQLFETI